MTLALLLNKKSPDKIQERRNNPSQNKKEKTSKKNKKEAKKEAQNRSQQKKLKKEAQHNNRITVSDEKYIQRKGKRPLIHKFYSKKGTIHTVIQ